LFFIFYCCGGKGCGVWTGVTTQEKPFFLLFFPGWLFFIFLRRAWNACGGRCTGKLLFFFFSSQFYRGWRANCLIFFSRLIVFFQQFFLLRWLAAYRVTTQETIFLHRLIVLYFLLLRRQGMRCLDRGHHPAIFFFCFLRRLIVFYFFAQDMECMRKLMFFLFFLPVQPWLEGQLFNFFVVDCFFSTVFFAAVACGIQGHHPGEAFFCFLRRLIVLYFLLLQRQGMRCLDRGHHPGEAIFFFCFLRRLIVFYFFAQGVERMWWTLHR